MTPARTTNSNRKTSTDTQMFLKTTNTPVFVPIVANVEAIIIVNLVCLAKDKKCNNCGIVSHFAKKCRETKKSQPQSSQSQQTKVKQITATSTKSDDEKPANYITSYQKLYDHVYDSHYDSDSADYVAAISSDAADYLKTLQAKIPNGKISAPWMIDSGSVCSIITKFLANKILKSTPSARWITTKYEKDLETISSETIKVLGKTAINVVYNDWICEDACLTIVGMDTNSSLEEIFSEVFDLQWCNKNQKVFKCVNNIVSFVCKVKQAIALPFPNLVSKIGLSESHVFKSKFHQKFTIKHQKARRLPINLQLRVTIQLDCQQKKIHTETISSCSDENFISPILIAVKKDQSIKIALDSNVLNKTIHKNNYQIPNIKTLKDSISQHLTEKQNGQEAYFTIIDLK